MWSAWPSPTPWCSRRPQSAWPSGFPAGFTGCWWTPPVPGEGMFRKEAAALADWSPELVEMCARRQAGILDAAAALLAPGGRLVYSTCTFAPQEDEGAVAAFLTRHPEFEIETLEAPGSPLGTAAPDLGWSIPSASGPTGFGARGHYAAVLRKAPGPAAPTPVIAKPDRLPASWDAFARDLGISLPAERPCPSGPAGSGPQRSCRISPGSGFCDPDWSWASAGRPAPAGPRPGPLALGRSTDPGPGSGKLGGRPIPGRGRASGRRSLRLDAGHRRRPLLGWGRGSGDVLKNHYPKGLRRRSS